MEYVPGMGSLYRCGGWSRCHVKFLSEWTPRCGSRHRQHREPVRKPADQPREPHRLPPPSASGAGAGAAFWCTGSRTGSRTGAGLHVRDTMYLLYNTMYPLRISLQSRYNEIQYILYYCTSVQIQWIQPVSASGTDTVDTYRTCRVRYVCLCARPRARLCVGGCGCM